MKQHIGSIYLILGLMSVSVLTIGAGKSPVANGAHSMRTQALLPSPTSFRVELGRNGKAMHDRILVIESTTTGAKMEARVAKALAAAKARKAG